MLATVVFTKSRGGFLGLAVVLLTLVFLGKKVRPGFGTMAVVAVLCASPFMPATFWERMASIVDDRKDKEEFTGTREARWTVMKEGIRGIPGAAAHRRRRRRIPELQPAWTQGGVARNA